MTIAATPNQDGSVTLTQDGVSITMHDYDVPTIVDACAHADVRHLGWAVSALLRRGRAAVDDAWKMVTGLKIAVDGEAPASDTVPLAVVEQAQAAIAPAPVAPAEMPQEAGAATSAETEDIPATAEVATDGAQESPPAAP